MSGVCIFCKSERCGRWSYACAESRGADDPRLHRMGYNERVATLSHEGVEDLVAVQHGFMSMEEKRRRDARRLTSQDMLTDEERSWLEKP